MSPPNRLDRLARLKEGAAAVGPARLGPGCCPSGERLVGGGRAAKGVGPLPPARPLAGGALAWPASAANAELAAAAARSGEQGWGAVRTGGKQQRGSWSGKKQALAAKGCRLGWRQACWQGGGLTARAGVLPGLPLQQGGGRYQARGRPCRSACQAHERVQRARDAACRGPRWEAQGNVGEAAARGSDIRLQAGQRRTAARRVPHPPAKQSSMASSPPCMSGDMARSNASFGSPAAPPAALMNAEASAGLKAAASEGGAAAGGSGGVPACCPSAPATAAAAAAAASPPGGMNAVGGGGAGAAAGPAPGVGMAESLGSGRLTLSSAPVVRKCSLSTG